VRRPVVTTASVSTTSRVRLYPLRMRPDGDGWCVGRIETGDFVVVPAIAVVALRLLGTGLSIEDVAERLREEHGQEVNVVSFVDNLIDLGYIAEVDGRPVPGPAPIRPTWPWLRPEHVRWALSPAVAAVVLVLPLAGLALLALYPHLVPTYRDLLWSPHGSLVLAGNAAICWSIIFLHELAHLATARAADVPGRVSLGTRLQFLAVQTDVSGIWAAPRRIRVTVYVAGMAVNLGVAVVAVAGRLVVGTHTTAGQILGATALLSILMLPPQLLLFMRTDVYFVVQDLAGCHNLYGDAVGYIRYLLRRGASDPTAAMPGRERRAVRAYVPVLVVGTALCLLFAATVTVPTAVTLFARAVSAFGDGASAGARLDGAATLLIVGGVWTLWCRAWWRRHGPRVAAWLARSRRQERR